MRNLNSNNLRLLDCTLRDGGYYNNWDFSKDLVNEYLYVMAKSGISFVEIGFRSTLSKDFKGSNWHTTDNYIDSLKIPKKINLAIMLNASEIISQNNVNKVIKRMFRSKNKSKIKLIRIACHFEEVEKTLIICRLLKNLGYKVAINLMQISEQNDSKIKKTVKIINKASPDILYFADSLGCMDPVKVKQTIKTLRTYWRGPLGIHAHDSQSKAMSNSLIALKSGVTWVDSTITGMGRGAGNAQTEYLLTDLNQKYKTKFEILPLLKLIKKYFQPLKAKYKWGVNFYYFLASIYRIHPTYIQEMIATYYSDTEILAAINQLKDSGGSKYNVDLVKSEFQKSFKLAKGNWAPFKKFKKREVLLIASGPKAKEYRNEIENYIKKRKPYVIAVNPIVNLNKKFINVYAACNPLKIIADVDSYKKISAPLVVPKVLLNNNLRKKFKKLKLFNFGIGLKEKSYKFYGTGAVIPKLYNIAYALSIASSGKASRILLAGFDGYGSQDKRTKLINELFYLYSSSENAVPITAITPTSYSVTSHSVYVL